MNNKLLESLRSQIDKADEDLLVVLARRQKTVKKIGKLKRENGIQPLDNNRWKELMKKRLLRARELNLSEDFVKNLYELIHKDSLTTEKG